jgi:hypothetical protein
VRPGVVADRAKPGFGSQSAAPPREPLADEEERPARAAALERVRYRARVRPRPVVEGERDEPSSAAPAVDGHTAAGEPVDRKLAGGSRAPAVQERAGCSGAGARQREGRGEKEHPHAWDTSPDAEGP